ncbi:3277_t:CDS:1, partial [Acaulospora morrowiae]
CHWAMQTISRSLTNKSLLSYVRKYQKSGTAAYHTIHKTLCMWVTINRDEMTQSNEVHHVNHDTLDCKLVIIDDTLSRLLSSRTIHSS